MKVNSVQDGSGRVHVTVHEQAAQQYASEFLDVSGKAQPTQLATIPVDGIARGQLLISATVADDPASGAAHQYLYLDVLIVGHVAGVPMLLARYALDQTQGQARFEFGEGMTFQAISIWARQVVDGAGDSTVTPKQAKLQATGTFWS